MLFRPARVSDLDAVYEILATPRQGPDYFRALFASDPAFEPAQIRVAWTGGHVVGCAKIYPRALRIGTAVVPVGGIGNLRMEPRHQDQGLTASLLAECLSAMRLQGAVLAPIFAAQHGPFAREGWSALGEPEIEIPAEALTASAAAAAAAAAAAEAAAEAAAAAEASPRGRVIRLPREIAVRPLESSDLDAVLALHESVNVARTGSMVRDCDTWAGSLAALDAQGARMLVAEHGGELAGYVVARQQQDLRDRQVRRVEVLELLLAQWSQEAWLPLLRAAAGAATATATVVADGEATILSACLPRDYRALIADALGEAAPALGRERDDLLVKVVDLPRLLKEIVPLLVTRLRKSPAPESLRLRIGPLRGGSALSIAGARVALDTPSRDDPHGLSESAFLALLFGTEGAHARLRDPAATGGLPPLPDWARETLERLFPPQDWIYWRSDAF